MTDSALVCPYCRAGHDSVFSAYVPFYSPEFVNMFWIISEDFYEYVEQIPLHAPVKASKGKNPKSPVIIREENWTTRKLPITDKRKEKAHIMPFLLYTLWKDHELIRWVEKNTPNTPKPQEQPILSASEDAEVAKLRALQEKAKNAKKGEAKPLGEDGKFPLSPQLLNRLNGTMKVVPKAD